MRLELPWHDGPQYLSPGDYLHASRNDIYGISAAVLKLLRGSAGFGNHLLKRWKSLTAGNYL